MANSSTILSSIKSQVLHVVPGARVLLFGSRANGIPTEESDWDILILTKEKFPKATKGLIQEKVFPISVEFATFINLMLVQEDDWKTNPRYYSLRKNIGDNIIVA